MYRHIFSFADWVTSLGGRAHPSLRRLLRYAFSGGTSTLVDFALLWFFIDIIGLYYLIAGAFSFIISVSVNYQINHFWGFKETRREFARGYSFFFTFGIIGLILTTLLFALFVEYFNFHYLIARALTAIFVGLWNYVMNIKYTFRTTLFGR